MKMNPILFFLCLFEQNFENAWGYEDVLTLFEWEYMNGAWNFKWEWMYDAWKGLFLWEGMNKWIYIFCINGCI